jgi:regulator of protease activity HflC (stomatin/prohibitin superfamily)
MSDGSLISLFFIGCIILILLLNTFKVLREYERGVIFLLGRFYKVKGPGFIVVIPFFQEMVRMQLRTIVMDVPSQDIVSRDNVSVRVNAVVYFHVFDPQKAVIKVENFHDATSQLSQTTLRSVLGQHELDEMLSEREKLNKTLKELLDKQTDDWGIKVTNVEIKDIDLNENMIRAIAKQAEAERDRRAKVIHAEGEQQAANQLLKAAQKLSECSTAIQLRYLQTLTEIAGEKNSTIIFPIDMIKQFTQLIHKKETK